MAAPGDVVTIADGAGPGAWWGNAGSTTPLTAANVLVGGVPAAEVSASISAASYNYSPPSPLVAPALSGSFVVPCGALSDAEVTVTEPNVTGLPDTVSASAPLTIIGGGPDPSAHRWTQPPGLLRGEPMCSSPAATWRASLPSGSAPSAPDSSPSTATRRSQPSHHDTARQRSIYCSRHPRDKIPFLWRITSATADHTSSWVSRTP